MARKSHSSLQQICTEHWLCTGKTFTKFILPLGFTYGKQEEYVGDQCYKGKESGEGTSS